MPSSNHSLTPPQKTFPNPKWEHLEMWQRVNDLIYSLPNYFATELLIKGLNVTEIFSIGGAFSTVVDAQVVNILNKLRDIWDPNNQYTAYTFIRQSQTFPDVLLKHVNKENDILFGIELKSWYVLSKEGEPSFRYKITPPACASADLLVIIPWILSEVISGSPRLLSPYKESAKYAAEFRNYYWQKSRQESGKNTAIIPPPSANRAPYPNSKQEASDKAQEDKGANFGRLARSGILDDYVSKLKIQPYLGIKIAHWIEFFKAISETNMDAEIERKIGLLKNKMVAESNPEAIPSPATQLAILEMLNQLELLWQNLS